MAGREVREYTNLTDPKDKKWGKSGKDRIDDEEITFQRMVAKMQEVAGERGGYLHGRGAMICFISRSRWKLRKMQSGFYAAQRNEHLLHLRAVAETSPASVPLPLRVEPKPKSGIRQQDLLKRVVEVKPKRLRVASPSSIDPSLTTLSGRTTHQAMNDHEEEKGQSSTRFSKVGDGAKLDNPVKSLLAAYESSDDED
ncbi:uncharacterized protein LOC105157380 isoform X2 [Sesamum indicum]|uniref:Uncharacterized protein LOC105157380 isoform X2 n=1 Tax=Sesamum indicum TaxID=4182 RepID=A0A8M8UVA4_SESIN|nr:uncharacterized protein LOC105157380 isoform X2 [Sesamum indicum]